MKIFADGLKRTVLRRHASPPGDHPASYLIRRIRDRGKADLVHHEQWKLG